MDTSKQILVVPKFVFYVRITIFKMILDPHKKQRNEY